MEIKKSLSGLKQNELDLIVELRGREGTDTPLTGNEQRLLVIVEKLQMEISQLVSDKIKLLCDNLKDRNHLKSLEDRSMQLIDVLEDAKVGVIRILSEQESNFTG